MARKKVTKKSTARKKKKSSDSDEMMLASTADIRARRRARLDDVSFDQPRRSRLDDSGQKDEDAVTEEALRRGSVDNVSVILVALNHGDGDDVDDDDRPGSAGAAEEVD